MTNKSNTSLSESSTFALDERRNPPPPSHYLASGAPTRCARCDAPFRLHDGLLACWRGVDERYYCSEACTASARRKTRAA